jgi:hypothetical protein
MAVVGQPQTKWTGWLVFAGVMMIVLGMFHAIDGFVALFKDDYYDVGESGLVVEMDYTAWGILHIILGAAAILGSISLFQGHMFGRIMGVVIAVISAVANMAFLAAYPIWSTVIIALDVIVIYAIVVHGREPVL